MSRRRDRRARDWARRVYHARTGQFPAVNVGNSMLPLLAPGRAIHLVRRMPRVGEVAVFRQGDGYQVHRVVAAAPGVFLFRGDRPGERLERVAESRVVGTWAPSGPWDLALRADVGRLVSRTGELLAHPAVRPQVARAWRWLQRHRPRVGVPVVEVADGVDPADAAALSRLGLWRSMPSLAEFADRYLSDTGFVVLARDGRGRAIGAVQVNPVGDQAWVSIAISAAWRRRGVGRALLTRTLEEARARGMETLVADIRRSNRASQGLFLGQGFQQESRDVMRLPRSGEPYDRYLWRG